MNFPYFYFATYDNTTERKPNDSESGGRISWDQNSTFSGDQIFDHEVKIVFVHEVEFVQ